MKSIVQAGILLTVMTIISGVVYPAVVTVIGQLLWAEKSNGSLIKEGNEVIGSTLIAQQFKKAEYFWPRPSASTYSALPSGATNLGPTSAQLAKSIADRRREFARTNDVAPSAIPMDLLTASASGLDPHISLEAARIQVKRIATARGLDEKGTIAIEALINDQLESPQLWILGEKRINVLSLNIGLDKCCGGN